MRFASIATDGWVKVGIETPEGWLNGTTVVGDVLGTQVETLPDMLYGGLFEDGPLAAIEDAVESQARPEWRITSTPILLPPVDSSSKIICVGRNYQAHAAERQKPWPDAPVFWQCPGSALLAPRGEIVIPRWYEGAVDHEAELGVVIATRAKNVQPEHAMKYVAGYTVINDVTARDQQDDDIAQGWPWFRGKGMDTFCPMGPGIVPRRDVPDLGACEVICRVNDEERQRGVVSDMRFDIPALIAGITKFITLEPGDVISTGTPGGVGPIHAGDMVECEVTGIGVIRNPVVRR